VLSQPYNQTGACWFEFGKVDNVPRIGLRAVRLREYDVVVLAVVDVGPPCPQPGHGTRVLVFAFEVKDMPLLDFDFVHSGVELVEKVVVLQELFWFEQNRINLGDLLIFSFCISFPITRANL